ncbi:hypothetical protein VIGAN_UM016800 [Vigna angularis var. angularis]|uniref:Uncharacterized protein n=1 Tax=Vigna angularis var. angularis TaxID=157739 RepID=A0A0S3TDD2_PHAAN|nr:hypothetical protein VIGAN_UM016800 [Vigna angularis var. angularis]
MNQIDVFTEGFWPSVKPSVITDGHRPSVIVSDKRFTDGSMAVGRPSVNVFFRRLLAVSEGFGPSEVQHTILGPAQQRIARSWLHSSRIQQGFWLEAEGHPAKRSGPARGSHVSTRGGIQHFPTTRATLASTSQQEVLTRRAELAKRRSTTASSTEVSPRVQRIGVAMRKQAPTAWKEGNTRPLSRHTSCRFKEGAATCF